jgi:hypothetical protein
MKKLILIILIGLFACTWLNGQTSKQCKAITQKGVQCKRWTSDKSGLCLQHLKAQQTKEDTVKRVIYTGSKGSRYYISNGIKHYIKSK